MTTGPSTSRGRGTTIAIIVAVVVIAGAIGGYFVLTGTKTSGSQSVSVNIPNGANVNQALNYSPHTFTLIIGVNNTVTFVNQDSAVHTVTSNDMSFDSGNIGVGASWTHTFSTPGTFAFHCLYHSWMTGTVVVKQAA